MFRNFPFYLFIIKVAYPYTVRTLRTYDNPRLAGAVPHIRRSAYQLYFSHSVRRTVKLTGVENLYTPRVYVFSETQLSETVFKYGKIRVIQHHTFCHSHKKKYQSAEIRENQRKN